MNKTEIPIYFEQQRVFLVTFENIDGYHIRRIVYHEDSLPWTKPMLDDVWAGKTADQSRFGRIAPQLYHELQKMVGRVK